MGEAEQLLETCICQMMGLGHDMLKSLYKLLTARYKTTLGPKMMQVQGDTGLEYSVFFQALVSPLPLPQIFRPFPSPLLLTAFCIST